MSKTDVMNKITRTFNKVGFKFKKHSPEILVITGIVGTVASAVMACKATAKVNGIMEEHKEQMNKIHEVAETTNKDEYSEEDLKKDTTIVCVQTGVKYAKLYGPSVALGVLSITSILAGHNITRKRNVALAAAYTAVDKSFKEYRGRVVERFGKDLDRELRYNIKAKEFTDTVKDEKTGKEKVTKNIVNVADPNLYSEYARIYDDGCNGWTKDPELNLAFLKKQQNYADDRLKARGYLFLNEVYDILGIPRTKAGQVVGWIYDEEHPIGDNFVDFGIFNADIEKTRDFVNGYERSIILDFNVDGPILDRM